MESQVSSSARTDREPLLTVNETATVLACSRANVYRLIRRRELRAIRVGARFRIRPEVLRRFLDEGEVRPG